MPSRPAKYVKLRAAPIPEILTFTMSTFDSGKDSDGTNHSTEEKFIGKPI
jgi:hypothetical protein